MSEPPPDDAIQDAGSTRPPRQPLGRDPWAMPQAVADRFVRQGRTYRYPDGAVAFRDQGRRLVSETENTEVIRSLLEIAQARSWTALTVTGSERFRREVWRQGVARDLLVQGYEPTAR